MFALAVSFSYCGSGIATIINCSDIYIDISAKTYLIAHYGIVSHFVTYKAHFSNLAQVFLRFFFFGFFYDNAISWRKPALSQRVSFSARQFIIGIYLLYLFRSFNWYAINSYVYRLKIKKLVSHTNSHCFIWSDSRDFFRENKQLHFKF